MTGRARFGWGVIPALVLLTAVVAGCSSTEEPLSGESNFPAPSTVTTVAVAPVTTQLRPSCSAATLTVAATPTFEGAAVVDVVCDDATAAATLTSGADEEMLVLFGLQNGAWVLVGSGPVDGDHAGVAPAGFNESAIPAWQRLRDRRLSEVSAAPKGATPTSTPPSSVRRNPEDGAMEVCTAYGSDFIECVPQTTPKPPPDPENPDDPEAPATPPVTSNFCRYNYNDTRCTESGQTYQPRGT